MIKYGFSIEYLSGEQSEPTHSCLIEIVVVYVYVIVREGVKFGIYPKISLLPVLSQINTIASFVKVKISDFQT